MKKLLYIKSSPRGSESKSSSIADAYLDVLKRKESGLKVDLLDLSTEYLPDFDGDKAAAKVTAILGGTHEGVQKTAWDEIVEIAQRFIAADMYLLSVPMWNGSIPYKLKHYIDIIHQPGLLWTLDPKTGYHGLLKNKKAILALTSGAFGADMPSPAFGVDFQSTYLKFWLNQCGIHDVREIRFQPTFLTATPEADHQKAIEEAKAAV